MVGVLLQAVQSGNIQGSCSDGNHAGENDGNNDEDHGNGDDGDEGKAAKIRLSVTPV